MAGEVAGREMDPQFSPHLSDTLPSSHTHTLGCLKEKSRVVVGWGGIWGVGGDGGDGGGGLHKSHSGLIRERI